eukprot:Skav222941  [mRNA]  locus=scaffold1489:515922:516326:+ [translate_table: standard]
MSRLQSSAEQCPPTLSLSWHFLAKSYRKVWQSLRVASHHLVPMPWKQRVRNGHLEWVSCFLWNQLTMDKWILDARIVLNQPVLTQLEVEVFQLVESEGMVMSFVKVAHLCLFLGNLCRRSGAWIRICCLKTKLW